jgi:hypothetical protein
MALPVSLLCFCFLTIYYTYFNKRFAMAQNGSSIRCHPC